MNPPKYQPLSEICKNSWHVVHRVVDSRGTRFLLKTARPGTLVDFASAKLRREFETLTQVETPGIPRYLEIHNTPNGCALLLADIDGVSLAEELNKPFSITDVLNLAHQLTEVLAKLHRLQRSGKTCLQPFQA